MAIPFKRIKTTYDFQDISPLSKYQSRTISWIIEFDPEYLEWCVKENLIYLTSKCLEALEDRLRIVKQFKEEQRLKKILAPSKSRFKDWTVHSDQDDWWDDVPF